MPITRVNDSSQAAATSSPSTVMAAAASRTLPDTPMMFIALQVHPLGPIRRMRDQEIANRQVVQVPLEERLHRIVRRADDRLLVHVKAGVDDRGNACQPVVLGQDPVKAWVAARC